MKPQTIIAANWKMNMTNTDAAAFAREFKRIYKGQGDVKTVICAPYTSLSVLTAEFKGTGIYVGAQNMYYEEKGTFTGEISCAMLADIGVTYVILGHSERRAKFGETDENVNKKVHAALSNGLTPIICVGETLEQRNAGITAEWVMGQVRSALTGVDAAGAARCVIAYEPIWAISKGAVLSGDKSLVATSETANDACGGIHNVLKDLYGADTADKITIQYGGSMDGINCTDLLAQSYISGGLIGGASLNAENFSEIVRKAQELNVPKGVY
ncbi:MAG: triose-phosphate isomerase [Clostridiales bacterium]|nr:triose-phosphate isomerase [Clostridiales bacterium]